jgi:3-methyladenine DNA glycosylase AlkD
VSERLRVRQEVAALADALAQAGDADRAAAQKRYLKSELEFVGVTMPVLRATARGWRTRHPKLEPHELKALVRALWRTPSYELRSLGIALLELDQARLGPEAVDLIEALLRASNTWAHVDWLAGGVLGKLGARHAEALDRLERWATDEGFWLRRSALLALLEPLRKGGGDFERFARLAAPMLGEKEFFIRKAIGWILREVSKQRPELTEAFLAEHAARVSGLTFREGSKYLPAGARASLGRLREAGR